MLMFVDMETKTPRLTGLKGWWRGVRHKAGAFQKLDPTIELPLMTATRTGRQQSKIHFITSLKPYFREPDDVLVNDTSCYKMK